MLYKPKL